MIIGTFNGMNIIGLPSDTIPGVRGPSSIEWDHKEVVASSTSPFTGQTQSYDWMQSWWEGTVSFRPMCRYDHDGWVSFLQQLRGPMNCFLMGDPKAKLPKGVASGNPVVSGASQTGYSLVTRGWTPGKTSILLSGDYVQVGYRLYSVTDAVTSDGSGNATLPIWPPLRDLPADGTAIVTRACKGLFRLKPDADSKSSVNVGLYGLNALSIKEAL